MEKAFCSRVVIFIVLSFMIIVSSITVIIRLDTIETKLDSLLQEKEIIIVPDDTMPDSTVYVLNFVKNK